MNNPMASTPGWLCQICGHNETNPMVIQEYMNDDHKFVFTHLDGYCAPLATEEDFWKEFHA